jgi:hypothetical protein
MLISNPLKKFFKNAHKKVISETSLTKVEKVHISVTFLLITFFCTFFYGSETLVIIEALISAKLQNKMRCKAWRSSRG